MPATAAQRRAAAAVPFWPGVTPNSDKDAAWRSQAAGSYLQEVEEIPMADITSNLVLRCKLNEPSGTDCIDSTGLHANGTYEGTFTTVAAPYGTDVARVFTSGSDASFASAADLQASRAMTCTFWAKTATSSALWICTKSNAAFTSGFEFGIANGSAVVVLRPVGLNYNAGSPDFNDDEWHHVAMSIEDLGSGNVRGKFWLDGAPQTPGGSTATTPTDNTDVVRIGSRRGSNNFEGALYDLRLYQRTFTDADAAASAAYRGEFAFPTPVVMSPVNPSIHILSALGLV